MGAKNQTAIRIVAIATATTTKTKPNTATVADINNLLFLSVRQTSTPSLRLRNSIFLSGGVSPATHCDGGTK
jgi:hypothetical protein